MKYSRHRILKSGHIELREVTDSGGFHRSVIAPNQPIEKYQAEIESDPNFAKYRTQENAEAYEAQLLADQPSEAELLEQWRNSFKVATYKLEIELEERGLMETVQTIIDQSPKSVRIGWNKSPTVRRMSQTVLGLASHPEIALTAEQLDDIFKTADQREL